MRQGGGRQGGAKLQGPKYKIHFSRPMSSVNWVPAGSHAAPTLWRAGDGAPTQSL